MPGIAPSAAGLVGKPPSGNTWNGFGGSVGTVEPAVWGGGAGCGDGGRVWGQAGLTMPRQSNAPAVNRRNSSIGPLRDSVRMALSSQTVLHARDCGCRGNLTRTIDTIDT